MTILEFRKLSLEASGFGLTPEELDAMSERHADEMHRLADQLNEAREICLHVNRRVTALREDLQKRARAIRP